MNAVDQYVATLPRDQLIKHINHLHGALMNYQRITHAQSALINAIIRVYGTDNELVLSMGNVDERQTVFVRTDDTIDYTTILRIPKEDE